MKCSAKKNYYYDALSRHKGNAKNMWKPLNSTIGEANDKTSIMDSLNIDGESISNENEIADGFCKYFSEIGHKCANNIEGIVA